MPHDVAITGLAILSALCQAPELTGPRATPPVELRLYRHATLAADEFPRSRAVVDAVFKPAALTLTWIDCDEDDARCRVTAPDRVTIDVLVLPLAKRGRPGVCGETAHSPANGAAIIVFASCARAVTAELRRGSKDPRLLTLQPADPVGLTIAHELGHVWGLPHSGNGLMMPRFDRDTLLALRSSQSAWTPDQIRRMARAIQQRQALLAMR